MEWNRDDDINLLLPIRGKVRPGACHHLAKRASQYG
jgi:hypothetical protein